MSDLKRNMESLRERLVFLIIDKGPTEKK